MKRLALLVVVVSIALGLLLHSCGKRKETEPPPPEDDTPPAAIDEIPDELPDELPEQTNAPILVGYVLREAVNVRAAAATDSASVGKVSRGDMLLILKSGTITGSNGGTWYEVRFEGKSAFIHSDYLETKEMAEDMVISIGSVVNVDSVLNIRSEPNAQSQRVGRANKGDKFVVLAQGAGDGSWTKVEYEEGVAGVAYIKSEYLNVVQQMLINMLLL
ncbi:MAG: SH3 domain-containing protein [Clostridiales bacterium]|nr:SH3 domain-containing protein [Clostridiales bacterium]